MWLTNRSYLNKSGTVWGSHWGPGANCPCCPIGGTVCTIPTRAPALASFPGLLRHQFLIACSMFLHTKWSKFKNWRWEGLETRLHLLYIQSCWPSVLTSDTHININFPTEYYLRRISKSEEDEPEDGIYHKLYMHQFLLIIFMQLVYM